MAKKELSSKVIEVFEEILDPQRLARVESVAAQRSKHLTIVLDQISNDHNMSAVVRSADAFGLAELHLVGESFKYSSGVARGSERWLNFTTHSNPGEAIASLHAQGFSLVVLKPQHLESSLSESSLASIPITELPFERKLALVFGNEQSGVSAEFEEAASYRAYIPMRGFVESLNVSVACAICLFCSTIAKTEPQRRTPVLENEEREALRAELLEKAVRRPDIILRDVARRNEKKSDR